MGSRNVAPVPRRSRSRDALAAVVVSISVALLEGNPSRDFIPLFQDSFGRSKPLDPESSHSLPAARLKRTSCVTQSLCRCTRPTSIWLHESFSSLIIPTVTRSIANHGAWYIRFTHGQPHSRLTVNQALRWHIGLCIGRRVSWAVNLLSDLTACVTIYSMARRDIDFVGVLRIRCNSF